MIALNVASAPQGAGEVVSTQTLWEFLASGGPVMIPIGLCSIVAAALAMERYLRVRRSVVLPAKTDEILELAESGRTREARDAAVAAKTPAARVLAAGLRRTGYSVEEVERAMEDQAQKELERLQAPIRTISVIANIAPLLGLLGTVIGIAEAFHRVVKTGMGKPENLAAGIEEALTTTIAGLVVAIPAMVLAAHLQGRVRKIMLRLDEKVAPVVEHVARHEESNAA
ncbi:MAG: MotA/TolQ/ExbB proton channel family protein [Planctomycetota bacterium]